MFGLDSASLSFVRPPYTCLIMRTSSGPSRSFSLRIGGTSVEELDFRQVKGLAVQPLPLTGSF